MHHWKLDDIDTTMIHYLGMGVLAQCGIDDDHSMLTNSIMVGVVDGLNIAGYEVPKTVAQRTGVVAGEFLRVCGEIYENWIEGDKSLTPADAAKNAVAFPAR